MLLLAVLEVSANTEYSYSVMVRWLFERACNQNGRGKEKRREGCRGPCQMFPTRPTLSLSFHVLRRPLKH